MDDLNEQSQAQFPGLPPFPDDVPTAPLLRISLEKLLLNDFDEVDRLWQACTELGFFYLDYQTTSDVKFDGKAFDKSIERLLGSAHEFYDLPVAEKTKYDFADQGTYHGYKGYGTGYINSKGTKDRNEFYNMAKDDILGMSKEPLPMPPVVEGWMPTLKSFTTNGHSIVTTILDHLNSKLNLPQGALSSLHPLKGDTDDQVRLVRSPAQPIDDRQAALGAHTDFGSVTLVFNRLGGLQILPPEIPREEAENNRGWLYVKPLPGHCVVNMGDAMVTFTRGVLRSCVHRVLNPPGAQSETMRFSLQYFSRPEANVLLRALPGSYVIGELSEKEREEEEVITSREWVLGRALGRTGKGDWNRQDSGVNGPVGQYVTSKRS